MNDAAQVIDCKPTSSTLFSLLSRDQECVFRVLIEPRLSDDYDGSCWYDLATEEECCKKHIMLLLFSFDMASSCSSGSGSGSAAPDNASSTQQTETVDGLSGKTPMTLDETAAEDSYSGSNVNGDLLNL